MTRTELLLLHLRSAEELFASGNLKPIERKRLQRAADRGMGLDEMVARGSWAADHLTRRAISTAEFLTIPGRFSLRD